MKIYDDRPVCSRCHDYVDDAALDRLPRDAFVHRAGPMVCTGCKRVRVLAETRAIAIAGQG
jgi:uncharacterized CHY-type Zn-finger protein